MYQTTNGKQIGYVIRPPPPSPAKGSSPWNGNPIGGRPPSKFPRMEITDGGTFDSRAKLTDLDYQNYHLESANDNGSDNGFHTVDDRNWNRVGIGNRALARRPTDGRSRILIADLAASRPIT